VFLFGRGGTGEGVPLQMCGVRKKIWCLGKSTATVEFRTTLTVFGVA